MHKRALSAGALFAGLAVILGAFGAHALKSVLPPDQLPVFETGVRYQFYHSIALLITGITFSSFPYKSLKMATTFFIIGIVLFSGPLYLLTALSVNHFNLGPVGILTPIGGLFFIAGWLAYFSGIIRNK
jgi:uncharacterized membrane protein YgdD (TMEM256/DUF423 family)